MVERMEGRFPTAARYLANMPDGERSYPELQVHTAGLGDVREVIEGPYHDLPDLLARYFRYEIDDDWVPEVLGQTTTLMLVDTLGLPALVHASRALAEKLYERPVLRHLIKLMSPTLVLMGTQRRWSQMRRGTSMTAAPIRREGDVSHSTTNVESPHPVFTNAFAEALAPFLEVAIEHCRGRDSFVNIKQATPTHISYTIRWRS